MNKRRIFNGHNLSPFLDSLTDKRLAKLLVDVEQGELSKEEIIVKNKLRILEKELLEFLPPQVIDKPCSNCGSKLYYRISDEKLKAIYCRECRHREGDSQYCVCDLCIRNWQLKQNSYIPRVISRSLEMSFLPYWGEVFDKGPVQAEKLKEVLYKGQFSCKFKLTLSESTATLVCFDPSDEFELCWFLIECELMDKWLEMKGYCARFHFDWMGQLHLSTCSEGESNIWLH